MVFQKSSWTAAFVEASIHWVQVARSLVISSHRQSLMMIFTRWESKEPQNVCSLPDGTAGSYQWQLNLQHIAHVPWGSCTMCLDKVRCTSWQTTSHIHNNTGTMRIRQRHIPVCDLTPAFLISNKFRQDQATPKLASVKMYNQPVSLKTAKEAHE